MAGADRDLAQLGMGGGDTMDESTRNKNCRAAWVRKTGREACRSGGKTERWGGSSRRTRGQVGPIGCWMVGSGMEYYFIPRILNKAIM